MVPLRFDDRGGRQLPKKGTAFRVFFERLEMGEDALDECLCRVRFVKGNAIRDGVQISDYQCGFTLYGLRSSPILTK